MRLEIFLKHIFGPNLRYFEVGNDNFCVVGHRLLSKGFRRILTCSVLNKILINVAISLSTLSCLFCQKWRLYKYIIDWPRLIQLFSLSGSGSCLSTL